MTKKPIYLVSVTSSEDSDVIHLPLLGTKWLHPQIDLSKVEGIIFTSKNGVEALEKIAPSWKRLPVLCVGKATRQKALELGANVLDTADGYGDGIGELLQTRYGGGGWVYARPKVIASDFADKARQTGVAVEEAVVYETVCLAAETEADIAPDAVLIFTSPSAAQCYRSRYPLRETQTVVVIGHTTASALQGYKVYRAGEPTVASCVLLAKQLAKEPL